VNEGGEHDIELIEAREDASEALQSPKEAFNLITAAIHGAIIVPRRKSIGIGWNDRDKAQIESKLASFIALISAIHEQMAARGS